MIVITTKLIRFTNFSGYETTIPKGTSLYVDLKKSIAFHNGIHFDICSSEYSAFN